MAYADQITVIRQTLAELELAHVRAALCVSQLQELLAVAAGTHPDGARILPRAEESRYRIVWQDRSCFLGHTKCFRLFACLLRRIDHYVAYDQLLREVWDGDLKSPDTVRSAVRELKRRLSDARMDTLADAIRGQGRHYGLILHESSQP
jgi:DNA-binding response OmpR family regulator